MASALSISSNSRCRAASHGGTALMARSRHLFASMMRAYCLIFAYRLLCCTASIRSSSSACINLRGPSGVLRTKGSIGSLPQALSRVHHHLLIAVQIWLAHTGNLCLGPAMLSRPRQPAPASGLLQLFLRSPALILACGRRLGFRRLHASSMRICKSFNILIHVSLYYYLRIKSLISKILYSN